MGTPSNGLASSFCILLSEILAISFALSNVVVMKQFKFSFFLILSIKKFVSSADEKSLFIKPIKADLIFSLQNSFTLQP